LPREWLKAASFVIREHMRAQRLGKKGKMAELLLSLARSGLTVPEFQAVIRADHGGLPVYLEQAECLIKAMGMVSGKEAPEGITGQDIGSWLFSQQVRLFQRALKETIH
jgi:tRNA nucleotidyltransferase (CCA-adding enzyme)